MAPPLLLPPPSLPHPKAPIKIKIRAHDHINDHNEYHHNHHDINDHNEYHNYHNNNDYNYSINTKS